MSLAKQKIFNLIIGISAWLLTSLVFAHNDNAYYHDGENLTSRKNWMSQLNDNIDIRHISIPGTHDSGSRGYGGDIVKTQSLTIKQQLDAGIRYLDIRLRHINNKFTIHHGLVYLHLNFDDVLTDVKDFLEKNPSETVYMRVKSEHTEENNTRSFYKTFEEYYGKYASVIWKPTGKTNIPLKETRGKIIFLQNFDNTPTFGIAYSSFNIQDDYTLKTNWDLYDKWIKIKNQLDAANKHPNSESGYLNHLTGSTGSFPYFVASGHSSPQTGAPRLSTGLTTPGWKNSYPDFPRVSCFIGICTIAFEGTNTLTKDHINNNQLRYVGIVIADFPGDGLIEAIIKSNFR